MRKRTVFGISMLLLVLLMSLMPVVKAATYYWDGLRFVEGYEGGSIKYPHPDRNYYGISILSTQGIDGTYLHHCQVDAVTSTVLITTASLLCALIGEAIGGIAGAIVGAALGFVIGYFSDLFLDELNCIWYWVSLAFKNWCSDNAWSLWLVGLIWGPQRAINYVLEELFTTGYIRVGALTFIDAIGMGNPSPYPRSLTISTTSGGTTNPLPGTYSYSDGASVTVTGKPNSGYQFWYWVVDGGTTPNENPITITMNRDHTLEAHFYYKSMCPTLFVWNGSEYAEEGVLNIHAREDVVVSHTLTVTPEPEGRKYLLRLTEPDLPNSHSYIDQVRLFVVDKLGNSKELRLIGAVHSEDGNVLPQLLFSDDARINTLPYQTIDLKFLAPIWQSEAEQFTFVIEGYNMK